MIDLPFIPEGYSVEKFGNGLINNTFKMKSEDRSKTDFLLQKINHNIFKDVEGLQNNIKQITDHIRRKLAESGCGDIDRRVLTPVEIDSRLYYKDANGDYWRMFVFIENTLAYDRMETPQMASVAGKAFGNFHKLLSDFPGETLCDVLPNFHNTPVRIESLRKSVALDPCGRVAEVSKEIGFLLGREKEFSMIVEMGEKGIIPKRVVHQDTKFNNVLLDADTNEVLCIIDLDTVMSGYICYDVGDAIRSGANTGREDETDLDKVKLNIEIYKGFLEGFTEETKGFLSQAELDTLPFGPKLLTYEQAVRFLTDYIDGDKYYKIGYPTHNLVRARTQIKLLQSMDGTI